MLGRKLKIQVWGYQRWKGPKFNDPDAINDIDEYLAIERRKYNLDNTPKTNHVGLSHKQMVKRLNQQHRQVQLIRTLEKLRVNSARRICETYIEGLARTNNKTYYINHIGYRYGFEIGRWSEHVHKNWLEFSKKKPSQIIDTYGNSAQAEKVKAYKQRKAEREKAEEMAIKGKKVKKTKSDSKKVAKKTSKKKVTSKKKAETTEKKKASSKKASGEKKKTQTGVIVDYFTKGGTVEGCVKLLCKEFPEKSEETLKKTLQVQLGYHLKKKYDIKKKGDKITLK